VINTKRKTKALRDEIADNVDGLSPEELKEMSEGLDGVDSINTKAYMMIGGLAVGLIILGILSM